MNIDTAILAIIAIYVIRIYVRGADNGPSRRQRKQRMDKIKSFIWRKGSG